MKDPYRHGHGVDHRVVEDEDRAAFDIAFFLHHGHQLYSIRGCLDRSTNVYNKLMPLVKAELEAMQE